MKKYLSLAFLIATFLGCQEKNEKSHCEQFDDYAIEMNETLNAVRTKHRAKLLFVRRLNSSQTKWKNYRNSHIQTLYPDHEDSYGDGYRECRCKEINSMMKNRIAQLSLWLEPADENAECQSSKTR